MSYLSYLRIWFQGVFQLSQYIVFLAHVNINFKFTERNRPCIFYSFWLPYFKTLKLSLQEQYTWRKHLYLALTNQRKLTINVLLYKSEAVYNAVYDSDWYNQSQRYKYCTRMIIMRGQRPVQITAGRFGTLSLPLFASVSVTQIHGKKLSFHYQ